VLLGSEIRLYCNCSSFQLSLFNKIFDFDLCSMVMLIEEPILPMNIKIQNIFLPYLLHYSRSLNLEITCRCFCKTKHKIFKHEDPTVNRLVLMCNYIYLLFKKRKKNFMFTMILFNFKS